ncbi:hypothetical protein TRM7557_03565 [Tritonibacter multivorans]|uniref:Glyceraldehyde-3-phosphate dehydrogenase n=1 Tax=Tritonibacter multivorans TaxID=928856 RepID=A0A0P1H164_9RHOB|nr:hypothetical protein [Tritonibacter multivorans]MDA7420380.1 hypothetical protein [Tritonibacter multivorans]CUH81701.1 hypothetical protein TRM7557_03565 [Tritonibacter multivorans]SFC41901.1 hypothetical protein SAMN04488049_102402 [Tritonibacter multivorans]
MTNRIAIGIGLFLCLALTLDVLLFGDQHIVFLGKKFIDLLHWVAFWR